MGDNLVKSSKIKNNMKKSFNKQKYVTIFEIKIEVNIAQLF